MDHNFSIQKNYTTPRSPGSYSALSGFLKNNKYRNKQTVQDTLSALNSYSLHKPIRKRFPRRKVVVSFMDMVHTIDLIDYKKYAYHNRGFRYILVVVDVFSKFLWTKPLKKKSAAVLRQAIFEIFSESKRIPKFYWGDAGSEFFNKEVKQLLKEYHVKLYHTFSKLKAMICEIKVKQIKTKLERYFTQTSKHIWYLVLPQITSNINNSYNRSIKMSPIMVTKKNESEVWHNLYDSLVRSKVIHPKYSVGDTVRISVNKLQFAKGYEANFGKEIFKIREVRQTPGAPTYKLEDLKGESLQSSFYNEDLTSVINSAIK